MDEEPEKSHQEEHPQAGDGEAMPAEQRAALQKGQGGMDEEEAGVGEGSSTMPSTRTRLGLTAPAEVTRGACRALTLKASISAAHRGALLKTPGGLARNFGPLVG